MAQPNIKIFEKCQISPAAGSVPPPTHINLTFFDYPWLFSFPKPLIFFDLPQPTDHIILTVVPKLKHSLSAALRHFYPLAADLICPPPPRKPHLRLSPCGASVSFTVAESGADFTKLVSDEPRDVTECHSLVPTLPPPSEDDGGGVFPVLAIQVTVYNNFGFSVGAIFNNVAADGRAFAHFMRSWALICRGLTFVDPCHDRDAIIDSYGLELVFLRNWWARSEGAMARRVRVPENTVRATFVLGRAQIKKLKRRVSALFEHKHVQVHVSSFVVAVALTWVDLIRTRSRDGPYHLCFLADCWNRVGFKNPIPETYFGNCLAVCFVLVNKSDVVGENGIFLAAQAIGEAVEDLKKGPLRGAATWRNELTEKLKTGHVFGIAGSAGLKGYQIDFGWGGPRKGLSIHIDESGGMSLAERVDDGGGLEIGLALDKDQMSNFSALFEQYLIGL